jgi:hypothetical protein
MGLSRNATTTKNSLIFRFIIKYDFCFYFCLKNTIADFPNQKSSITPAELLIGLHQIDPATSDLKTIINGFD